VVEAQEEDFRTNCVSCIADCGKLYFKTTRIITNYFFSKELLQFGANPNNKHSNDQNTCLEFVSDFNIQA
jgi:hypothetical protein